MTKDDGKIFEIVYKRPEGCPSLPVGGCYGGASLDGNLVTAHFYTEYGSIPSAMVIEVVEDGQVDLRKAEKVVSSDLTREIHVSLNFPPDVAESVGKWLMEKAAIARKNERNRKKQEKQEKKEE